MKRQNWILALAIVILGTSLIGASGANKSAKNPALPHSTHFQTIKIKNMTFSPAKISISAGDTVEWVNSDNVPHMLNSDTGTVLQSPLFNPGKKFHHVFDTAGKFPYHCAIHPTMQGTITVK
jgi:plastocyanin